MGILILTFFILFSLASAHVNVTTPQLAPMPTSPPQPQPQPPTNISIQLPPIPPAQVLITPSPPTVVNTSVTITPVGPTPTPAPAPAPAPVIVGPPLHLIPIPVQPVPPKITLAPPTETLLERIHSIPELGLLSLYLTLPFNNATQTLLNQTNTPGIASQITVFGPSNLGVLRFLRKLIGYKSIKAVLPRENTTCDDALVHELQRLAQLKVAYKNMITIADAFHNVTAARMGQTNVTAHQQLLQALIPMYQQMYANMSFTEEEKQYMRANLLYHIANTSINVDTIPPLSFYPSLMNDSRFVALNSITTPTPIKPQNIQIVKKMKGGKEEVALQFGVPGSGYYKARVYPESQFRNIAASNGILHVIDRIQYIPTNLTKTLMIADLFGALSAFNKSDLLPRIEVTPNITLFIPTDEAIAFSQGYHAIRANRTLLFEIILRHIITGVHYTTDLVSPHHLLNYNNEYTTVRAVDNNTFTIEGATIVIPNILFKNGVIHVIDRTLVSPAQLAAAQQPSARTMAPHYPSQPFPLTPPFHAAPTPSAAAANITCPSGDAICHIVNPVTNKTSPYPVCYSPKTHVCVNGVFLCPVNAPAACGVHCYNTSTHECISVFAEGRLHYHLTKRTKHLMIRPTLPAPLPVPKCPLGDEICSVVDMRKSTKQATPTCYNPYTHVCSNSTFLCPVTHPSLCGISCYHTVFYTCSYGFYNNTYSWHLTPTPTLIALETNKTAPAAQPAPTPTPVPTPKPTPTPTPKPVVPPTTVTCIADDEVCLVRSPFNVSASSVPTCFSPKTHVCANNTFLCPHGSPLLCNIYCYNPDKFTCINNTLKLKSEHMQPRLATHVAARLHPQPLPIRTVIPTHRISSSPISARLDVTAPGHSSSTVTHLPSRIDLSTTIQPSSPHVTVIQPQYPRTISVELPSGRTDPPGLVVTRSLSLPRGARLSTVANADLSSIADVIASLSPENRARLMQSLPSSSSTS